MTICVSSPAILCLSAMVGSDPPVVAGNILLRVEGDKRALR